MLNRFLHTIRSGELFNKTDRLFIAASGGLDSSVLCELCHQAGFPFTIAHCNFQLRGEESERDEQFARGLGKKYHCEVLVKKFDTEKYAAQHKLSIQEAARNLRYDWFRELADNSDSPQTGAKILTAHHLDDSIETMLMNFFRGTGLQGLTGIPVKNGAVRRPLLQFTRRELENFAMEHELQWVEDSSNISSHYTRNYFRNELLPALEKVFPQVRQNLEGNLHRFSDIEKLYRVSTARIIDKLLIQKGNEWQVPVKALMKYQNRSLVYEIISRFGFSEKQIDEVIRLAESDSGKYMQSADKNYRLIRHRLWFIFSPAASSDAANIIIEKDTGSIAFEKGRIDFTPTEKKQPPADPSSAMIDASKLEYPLLLRKAKTGDYFYPLGMTKKKKLSRFFIDQKLSKSRKENTWVLENGNGRIIWVLGMRIDERFKVGDDTRTCLILNVKF